MKLYEAIDVWHRAGDGAVSVYKCFRVLPIGRYCVQSKDYFSQPDSNVQHQRQFVELLGEQPPDERSGSFDTLEQAISAFENSFNSV